MNTILEFKTLKKFLKDNIKRKNSVLDILLFLYGLLSTFMIVQIKDRMFSWYLGIMIFGYIVFTKPKLNISLHNMMYFGFIICTIFSQRLNILSLITTIILFIQAEQFVNFTKSQIHMFFNGLKLSCIIHLLWCIIQFICFKINIDINDVIFKNTLHLVSNASFGVYITGLAWHPCNLVPTLVLTILLFNRWYIWLISVFVAINANSSTTILALIITFVLLFPINKDKITALLKKWNLKKILLVLSILILMIFTIKEMFPFFFDEVVRLFERINGGTDKSTSLHLRYYTSLIEVWKNSGLYDIFFGVGYHNSGKVFSRLYGQYDWLDFWSVESDPMDYMYGTGIFGFVIFYSWIIKNIVKSLKKNYRCFVFYTVILICGIAYNCQFDWVIQLELIFNICISRNITVFTNSEKKMTSWI